ncbi:hypothetical protein LTR28_011687 [Elasticomyces elasticus]|nr:hypothetical protein LTR28_011687 [Elasticomyces elasticus]
MSEAGVSSHQQFEASPDSPPLEERTLPSINRRLVGAFPTPPSSALCYGTGITPVTQENGDAAIRLGANPACRQAGAARSLKLPIYTPVLRLLPSKGLSPGTVWCFLIMQLHTLHASPNTLLVSSYASPLPLPTLSVLLPMQPCFRIHFSPLISSPPRSPKSLR